MWLLCKYVSVSIAKWLKHVQHWSGIHVSQNVGNESFSSVCKLRTSLQQLQLPHVFNVFPILIKQIIISWLVYAHIQQDSPCPFVSVKERWVPLNCEWDWIRRNVLWHLYGGKLFFLFDKIYWWQKFLQQLPGLTVALQFKSGVCSTWLGGDSHQILPVANWLAIKNWTYLFNQIKPKQQTEAYWFL